MPTLTPSQAAAIADGAYRVLDLDRNPSLGVPELLAETRALGADGLFAVGGEPTFRGVSGVLAWTKLSRFGYAAAGVGAFQGEALIATRGTALLAYDGPTDLNIGLQLGPGGLPVHTGFNKTWRSFASDLEAFLARHRPTRVHCVGHSLGGALATLNADYLSARHIGVELYTFGSPRVGDALFSASLTRRLGAGSIHRVAHPSDPVPMIPLFPFWHAPIDEDALCVARGQAGAIDPAAHKMSTSYVPGVRNHSWASLANAPGADGDLHVKSWLERGAEGHGAFMRGSATLLTMISRALAWILKKAGQLVLNGVSASITAGLTVLDLISALLSRASELSRALAGHVKTLIGAIFRFLGRAVSATADLTTTFLRWVLGMLFGTVASAAQRALSLLS